MKMKLYYVVKKANGLYDEHDFDYVAGPFNFDDAYEYKNAAYKGWDSYVVSPTVEGEH